MFEPELKNAVNIGQKSFTPGDAVDELRVDLTFTHNTLSGGSYGIILRTSASEWPTDGVTTKPVIGSRKPAILGIAPTTVPANSTTLDLVIRGTSFANPSVDVSFTPHGGGGVTPVLTQAKGLPPDAACPASSCIHLIAPIALLGRDGSLKVVIANFDSPRSDGGPPVSVTTTVSNANAWSSNLGTGKWVRAGVPSELRITDNSITNAVVANVEVDNVVLQGSAWKVAGNAVVLPAFNIARPGDERDSLSSRVDVVLNNGNRVRADVPALVDPDGFAPVAVYGVDRKAQPISIRARHLKGLTLVAGKGLTISSPVVTGDGVTATVTPQASGSGDLHFYRENVRVHTHTIAFVPAEPLANLVRVVTGNPNCGTPSPNDVRTSVKLDPRGKVCIRILGTTLKDVDLGVADTISITVQQDDKSLVAPPSRVYSASAGTGAESEIVSVAGAEQGAPFQIVVKRGQEQVPIDATTGLRTPVGFLAAFTVSTYALGAIENSAEEKRVSTAASPQIGAWFSPNRYNRYHKGFFAVMPVKRSYCNGSSEDVISLGTGYIYRDLVTVGLGVPLEQGRIPRQCSAAGAASGTTSASEPEKSQGVAGRWVLLLLSIKAS